MGKRRRLTSCCLVIAGLWCGVGSSLSAQDNNDQRAELAKQIHETIERVHTVRFERADLQKRYRQEQKVLEQQIARLESDLEASEESLSLDQQRVSSFQKRVEKQAAQSQQNAKLLKQTAKLTLVYVRRFQSRVLHGIPYRRDQRNEKLNRVIQDLGHRDPAVAGETVIDFMAIASDELQLGQSIDLWNESVSVSPHGRRVHAYQLRLGLVQQAFVSEDGQWSRLASFSASQPWETQINDTHQEQLLQAIRILQKQSPPRLVPFPFSFAIPVHADPPLDGPTKKTTQEEGG